VRADEVVAAAHGGNVLGVVRYTNTFAGPELCGGHPELTMHMTDDADEGFVELWTTGQPVESGAHGGISYAHDGEYLFCAGRVPPSGIYAEGAKAAYFSAFDVMQSLGYRRILRMWNFIDGINEDNAAGMEIYRDFVAVQLVGVALYGSRHSGCDLREGVVGGLCSMWGSRLLIMCCENDRIAGGCGCQD
jgi:hypothetical protein